MAKISIELDEMDWQDILSELDVLSNLGVELASSAALDTIARALPYPHPSETLVDETKTTSQLIAHVLATYKVSKSDPRGYVEK